MGRPVKPIAGVEMRGVHNPRLFISILLVEVQDYHDNVLSHDILITGPEADQSYYCSGGISMDHKWARASFVHEVQTLLTKHQAFIEEYTWNGRATFIPGEIEWYEHRKHILPLARPAGWGRF